MATIFGRTQSFRPGMHETVLDAFIPASDVPTPRLVSEKAHPNNYTVVTEDSGPKIHVDFIEYTSFYVFHADMPGFKKEDISVVCGDDMLILEAHKSAFANGRDEDADGKHLYQERKLGTVHRTFRLPHNASCIPPPEAKYKDGVLTLVFDKTETTSTKAKLTIL